MRVRNQSDQKKSTQSDICRIELRKQKFVHYLVKFCQWANIEIESGSMFHFGIEFVLCVDSGYTIAPSASVIFEVR